MKEFNETFWINKIEAEFNKSLLLDKLDIVKKRVNNNGDIFTFLKNGKELWASQAKYFSFIGKNIIECQESNRVSWEYFEYVKKEIDLCRDNYIFGKFKDIPEENILLPLILTKDNASKLFKCLKDKIKYKNKLYSFVNKDIFEILKKSDDFKFLHGKLGEIAGIYIYLNESIPIVNNEINVMVFAKESISFASNIVKIEQLRDKNSINDIIHGIYVYGCEINNLQNVSGCIVNL